MTPDHSRMVSSSSIAEHPQYPKSWFSSCLGQKKSAWRREEKSQGKFLSLCEAKFQEPPWLDFQAPPCSPPASFPSSGEVWGGWVAGPAGSRQGLSQSLPSQVVGRANFLPVSGTCSLGCQFPGAGKLQPGTPYPRYPGEQEGAPGSYLHPHKHLTLTLLFLGLVAGKIRTLAATQVPDILRALHMPLTTNLWGKN